MLQNRPFDITTKQPQLSFVAIFNILATCSRNLRARWRSCWRTRRNQQSDRVQEYLDLRILERFAGIRIFTEVVTDEQNNPIYLRTTARPRSHSRRRIAGHGRRLPQGRFRLADRQMETDINDARAFHNDQLHALGIVKGKKAKLEFVSGIIVSRESRKDFASRRQAAVNHILKLPREIPRSSPVRSRMGNYDMAVGERIDSVFNGAADKDAYNQVAVVPKERTSRFRRMQSETTRESLRTGPQDSREQNRL